MHCWQFVGDFTMEKTGWFYVYWDWKKHETAILLILTHVWNSTNDSFIGVLFTRKQLTYFDVNVHDSMLAFEFNPLDVRLTVFFFVFIVRHFCEAPNQFATVNCIKFQKICDKNQSQTKCDSTRPWVLV